MMLRSLEMLWVCIIRLSNLSFSIGTSWGRSFLRFSLFSLARCWWNCVIDYYLWLIIFLSEIYHCFGDIFKFFSRCYRDKTLDIFGIIIDTWNKWTSFVFLFRKIRLLFFRKILKVYNKKITDEFSFSEYLER